MPSRLEEYVQESDRGGRDGSRSRAIPYQGKEEKYMLKFHIGDPPVLLEKEVGLPYIDDIL